MKQKIKVYKVPYGFKALNVRRSDSLKSELQNLLELLEALKLKRYDVLVQGIDF